MICLLFDGSPLARQQAAARGSHAPGREKAKEEFLLKNQTQPDLLRPRWSKVVSDLWGNKFRTLLVVASITVGVFAIGMIATAYTVLSQDIDLSFELTNPANIEISTDPFDQNFLNGIEQVAWRGAGRRPACDDRAHQPGWCGLAEPGPVSGLKISKRCASAIWRWSRAQSGPKKANCWSAKTS